MENSEQKISKKEIWFLIYYFTVLVLGALLSTVGSYEAGAPFFAASFVILAVINLSKEG